MNQLPFQPTTCDCKEDQENCKKQPGHLMPGQLQKIAEYLKLSLEETKKKFWNSPGMLLWSSVSGKYRVRTITPRFENGKCVFFNKEGHCDIHEVAPFGCRYFDIHMDAKEGQKRAVWGARTLLDQEEEYAKLRDSLPEATHYAPRIAI